MPTWIGPSDAYQARPPWPLTVLVTMPARVAAQCNGSGCPDGLEQPVDGIQALLLVVLLVIFGSVLALGDARRR
jgi:hypothetical protein